MLAADTPDWSRAPITSSSSDSCIRWRVLPLPPLLLAPHRGHRLIIHKEVVWPAPWLHQPLVVRRPLLLQPIQLSCWPLEHTIVFCNKRQQVGLLAAASWPQVGLYLAHSKRSHCDDHSTRLIVSGNYSARACDTDTHGHIERHTRSFCTKLLLYKAQVRESRRHTQATEKTTIKIRQIGTGERWSE